MLRFTPPHVSQDMDLRSSGIAACRKTVFSDFGRWRKPTPFLSYKP